ncbi:egg envelope protein [Triplophysa rosa]|uniref:Zona pellucida sperm-binding protein 3 n=1 Tax=Triplophysa rosa TaxID=992332 RepID=A0A9W7X605_TRIRA|nr:egg envelope protein [Triplophysa rosa]
MGLVACFSVEFLLFLAVGLSVEQWSGFQQGQAPVRFQQQQTSTSASQQAPQGSAYFQASRTGMSSMVDPWRLIQEGNSQSKQLMQGPVAPLTWQYPLMPEEPLMPEVPFELRTPSPSVSVAARCGENFVQVEVKKDFYGNGQFVDPAFLSLGGCGAVGEDPDAQILIFETELQTCGSSLTMTADALVYTFTLRYTPETVGGTPIVRAEAAVVPIECHYPRLHNVSSNALIPAWVPFAATRVGEEVLVFSLKLMTDDWMFERPANQYFLGQFMTLEASMKQYNHVPLRIFIETCVATAALIGSKFFPSLLGAWLYAKLTGSPSRFMRRVQNDKLQFQLEDIQVYVTCALKAVIASTPH